MRKVAPILLRLALLVAVLASAVLLVEYQNIGDPAFCGAGSGCVAVHRWAGVNMSGLSLPVFGLTASAALLVFVLLARAKAHAFAVGVMAVTGALAAVALIVVQKLVIQAFCKWCMTVDVAIIVAAALAVWIYREVSRDQGYEAQLGATARRRWLTALWIAGAALTALLPVVWGRYPVVPPLPSAVAELAVPGKVTVVSFTDFECPFCRKMHPVLHQIVASSGGRMVLVRKMVPLGMHPGARPAALAYFCAPEERRDEMADTLYTVPVGLLTRAGVVAVAEMLHLDGAAFARCLEAPETAAAIERDTAVFKAAGGYGLPTTYIGDRVIGGFDPAGAERLGRLALAGPRTALPVGWMFAAFAVIAGALAALTVRFAPREGVP